MKRNILKLSAALLAAVVIAFSVSCTDSGSDASPVLSIYPPVTSVVLDSEGAQASSGGMPISTEFMVATNQESWDVSSSQPWLQFIKMSHGFIMYADPNTTMSTQLTAEVTVTSGKAAPVTIGVTQSALGPVLAVSPKANNITVAYEGGSEFAAYKVSTNVGDWTVASSDSWLKADKSETGFTLSADQNLLVINRATEITVSAPGAKDVVIRVSQGGGLGDLLDRTKFQRWNPPGIPYSALDDTYHIEFLWDGLRVYMEGYTYWYLTGYDGNLPFSITFDMGQTAILSHFKVWQLASMAYQYFNVSKFQLWGSPTPDVTGDFATWTFLGEYSSIKPSGLPGTDKTPEDTAYALAGEQYIIAPENRVPVRYIRFHAMELWTGANYLFCVDEMEFYGALQD